MCWMIRRFPTMNTTTCCAGSRILSASTRRRSHPIPPRSAWAARRCREFAPVEHPVPLESLQDVFNGGEVGGIPRARGRNVPGRGIQRRAEGRRAVRRARIPRRRVRPRRDARRRPRRRGRDGESAHDPLHPHDSCRKSCPRLIVRGEVYMARSGLCGAQRPARAGGKAASWPTRATRQRARCASSTRRSPRSGGWTSQSSTFSSPRGARSRPTQRRWTICKAQHFKVISGTRRLRRLPEILAEIERLNDDAHGASRSTSTARSSSSTASPTARCSAARRSVPSGPSPIKYPPEKKPAKVLDIVVQVGRTGVLTPKAVLEPRASGGDDRHERDAPQPGLYHPEGYPYRRHGHRPARRGRSSQRSWRSCSGERPETAQPYCPARYLPGLRRARHARPGRRRRALHGRGVPGAAAAQPHPLRQRGTRWTSTGSAQR